MSGAKIKDVKVEGQPLAAGKYGFFTIPNADEWTIIFNKVPNQWGAFKYDQKQDALRVMAAWGFRYVSNFVWAKRRKDGGPDGRDPHPHPEVHADELTGGG